MILLKNLTDIHAYYLLKWTEWFMIFPTFMFALALVAQPDMFDLAPHYTTVDRWADESVWRNLLFISALMRLVALITRIDSTFICYCPFLRFSGSLIGTYVFGELALGFFFSYQNTGSALGPVVTHLSLAIIDGRNLYKSSIDVGLVILGKRVE